MTQPLHDDDAEHTPVVSPVAWQRIAGREWPKTRAELKRIGDALMAIVGLLAGVFITWIVVAVSLLVWRLIGR